MADGDVVAKVGALAKLGTMNHGEVLNIGVFANTNFVDVTAHDAAVPNPRSLANMNIANDGGSLRDESLITDCWHNASVR